MSARINWYFFGIITSVTCAVHCGVLRLLISSLPIFGINIINNSPFEWLMMGVAFIIESIAILQGYPSHPKSLISFYLFIAGFIFLVIKQFFHDKEFIFLAPAVCFILYAHFLNYQYIRQSKANKSFDKIRVPALLK